MNRLRVRVGSQVREFVLAEEEQHCLECITLAVKRRVFQMCADKMFSLTDIGALAWDIYIDERKVGHAKAFDHTDKPHKPDSPTLWGWFILIVSCYLALC